MHNKKDAYVLSKMSQDGQRGYLCAGGKTGYVFLVPDARDVLPHHAAIFTHHQAKLMVVDIQKATPGAIFEIIHLTSIM